MFPAWNPTFFASRLLSSGLCPDISQTQSRLYRLDVKGSCAANAPLMNTSDLQKLTDWLIDGARSALSPPLMMAESCERLVGAGLPLWRVGVFVRTLHPDILGYNFIWRPGAEVVVGTAGFDMLDSPEYRNSPLAIVFGEEREVRFRLDDPESRRFPFFDDMRAEGVTDYIALPLAFTSNSIHASSWTTKQ